MKMVMLFVLALMLGAIALTASTAAFAAEPASPAPKKECCYKKGEDGKMACCDKDAKSGHDGHDMSGMPK